MHVCYSLSAIEAGTSLRRTASLAPRLGEAVEFFQNERYCRFKQTKQGILLGIVQDLNVFQRREAGGGQASAGIGDEETRSRVLQRSERPLTWRAFCPFRDFALSPIAGGLPEGCHVQERAETS